MRKTPLTLGVLAIVFGSIVALYDGFRLVLTSLSGSFNKAFSGALANAPHKPGEPDPTAMMAKLEAVQRELQPYTMALLAAMVLFSIALIVIGVGLYKRKTWARSAALGWSVLGLLYVAADTLVHLKLIVPRTQAAMRAAFAAMPDADKLGGVMQVMGGAQNGIIVLTAVALAVLPVLLLILLGRRSAAADFVD